MADAFTALTAGETDLQAFTDLQDGLAEITKAYASATAPTNPVDGMPWYDSGNNAWKIRAGCRLAHARARHDRQ